MFQCVLQWRLLNSLPQNLSCSAFKLSFVALAFLNFSGTSAYGRSMDHGGQEWNYDRVDVEGRQGGGGAGESLNRSRLSLFMGQRIFSLARTVQNIHANRRQGLLCAPRPPQLRVDMRNLEMEQFQASGTLEFVMIFAVFQHFFA